MQTDGQVATPIRLIRIERDEISSGPCCGLTFFFHDEFSPEGESEVVGVLLVDVLPVVKIREGGLGLFQGLLNVVVFQQQLMTPPLGAPSLRLTPTPPVVRLFPGPASATPQLPELGFQLPETGFGSFASGLFFTMSGLFFPQAP